MSQLSDTILVIGLGSPIMSDDAIGLEVAEEIEKMLAAVGLDKAEFHKLYSDKKIADAILYAKELKDRYTVLWLHYDLFGGEEA